MIPKKNSIIFFTICSVNLFNGCALIEGDSHRTKRQLLFPNATLFQFNAGLSTPSPVDHIFVNWAIQANFNLPWNRTQIPLDIFEANSGYTGDSRKRRGRESESLNVDQRQNKNNYEDAVTLVHFYKYVAEFMNGFGQNGTSCVLRTLCEVGAAPLHSDDSEDLLHEIANFLLNPRNDVISKMSKNNEIYPYIKAHNDGHKLRNCSEIYHDCKLSLVDIFSRVEDVS